MNLVIDMSNSQVFGTPMILAGRKFVSPFGAAGSLRADTPAAATAGQRLARRIRSLLAPTARSGRIRKTVLELSRLDDRMLRDIGLDRSAIISAASEADSRRSRTCGS